MPELPAIASSQNAGKKLLNQLGGGPTWQTMVALGLTLLASPARPDYRERFPFACRKWVTVHSPIAIPAARPSSLADLKWMPP